VKAERLLAMFSVALLVAWVGLIVIQVLTAVIFPPTVYLTAMGLVAAFYGGLAALHTRSDNVAAEKATRPGVIRPIAPARTVPNDFGLPQPFDADLAEAGLIVPDIVGGKLLWWRDGEPHNRPGPLPGSPASREWLLDGCEWHDHQPNSKYPVQPLTVAQAKRILALSESAATQPLTAPAAIAYSKLDQLNREARKKTMRSTGAVMVVVLWLMGAVGVALYAEANEINHRNDLIRQRNSEVIAEMQEHR
jgi:hypothetical protein